MSLAVLFALFWAAASLLLFGLLLLMRYRHWRHLHYRRGYERDPSVSLLIEISNVPY